MERETLFHQSLNDLEAITDINSTKFIINDISICNFQVSVISFDN